MNSSSSSSVRSLTSGRFIIRKPHKKWDGVNGIISFMSDDGYVGGLLFRVASTSVRIVVTSKIFCDALPLHM